MHIPYSVFVILNQLDLQTYPCLLVSYMLRIFLRGKCFLEQNSSKSCHTICAVFTVGFLLSILYMYRITCVFFQWNCTAAFTFLCNRREYCWFLKGIIFWALAKNTLIVIVYTLYRWFFFSWKHLPPRKYFPLFYCLSKRHYPHNCSFILKWYCSRFLFADIVNTIF